MSTDELRSALSAGDAVAARRLFERDPRARAEIDAPVFPFDSPALVHFAGRDDLAMVNVLLDMGADPNRRSDWWAGGFHALHVARGAVADRLLACGAVPDACAAARVDRIDLLEEIVGVDGSRVHERGGDGQTPLHFARSGRVVDFLLDRGADVDARDVDHRSTPAQWMLDRHRDAGRYDLALHLVERGATCDVFLSAALGLVDRLRDLLGADPSVVGARTGRGEYGAHPPAAEHIYAWTIGQNLSPLQVAAQFEQREAVEVLRGFSGPRDRLLVACSAGDAEEARRIVEERPRVVQEIERSDPRIVPDAAWAGNAATVEILIALGFDPTVGGQDGGTVLHCAAWQGHAGTIAVALRHEGVQASIESRDPVHGSTPLGWCCHGSRYCANPGGDYPAVARMLLEAGARPGPNLQDATPAVLEVISSFG